MTAITAMVNSNAPTHEPTIPHTSTPLPLHLQSTWSSHGWTLRDSSRRTCATATAWLSLIKSGELKHWQVKRGGFYQHDTHLPLTCSFWDAVRARLLILVVMLYYYVYLDESYIHGSHQMKQGWHPTTGPHKNNETRGEADTGKRLIIIHAMSQDGMLDVEDAVGSNFLHEQTPTAQFVFEAASFDDSDYHNSIDGEAFTLWMKNRLIPTFQHLYPRKKMIIVMDNASYHKPRGYDWITPYKMNKVQCSSFFEAQGVTSITVQRDGAVLTFHHHTFNLHARNKAAPTLKEMQQAVRSHLHINPHINKTEVDKLLHPLGYSIVWTPPFVPEVQPIELIWAHVKSVVASRYTLNRTVDQTRQQTDDAFDTITATMIQKRIAHCHTWIDAFMQTDEAGALRQYDSLMQLVHTGPITMPPPDLSSPILDDFLQGSVEDELEDE